MRKDGGPAFPGQQMGTDGLPVEELGRGMSLRDHFAAKALPECIRVAADQTTGEAPLLSEMFSWAAAYAYHAADAMLAERDK